MHEDTDNNDLSGFAPATRGVSSGPGAKSSLVRYAHRLLKHLDEQERARVLLATQTKRYKADRSEVNRHHAEIALARFQKAAQRVERSKVRMREAVERAGGRS
jgi:hypothetical protein